MEPKIVLATDEIVVVNGSNTYHYPWTQKYTGEPYAEIVYNAWMNGQKQAIKFQRVKTYTITVTEDIDEQYIRKATKESENNS